MVSDAQTVPQPLPPEAVQLMTPQGAPPSALNEVSERFLPYLQRLNAEAAQNIYRTMVTTRRVDQEATALQRQGQLVLWVPSSGQEGAQAGALAALAPQDWIFPTYREHAMALGRGVTPRELLLLFRGAAHSGWNAEDYRVHPYTLVLAAQALHATGYAWGVGLDQCDWTSQQRAENGEVVLACFGDGASSEGDIHESMVFAASYDAPVVFFCQNNHWAISVPFEVQSRVPIARRAAGYGFDGVTVDGNDPLATYAVTAWAAEQARSGTGPVLVEAHTYRMGAHTTADDPTKYRGRDEEQSWSALDPITRMRSYLTAQDLGDDAFFSAVDEEAEDLAAQTRQAVLSMTAETIPVLDDVFAHAYAEPHPLVEAERAWHHTWEAGFAETEGENR